MGTSASTSVSSGAYGRLRVSCTVRSSTGSTESMISSAVAHISRPRLHVGDRAMRSDDTTSAAVNGLPSAKRRSPSASRMVHVRPSSETEGQRGSQVRLRHERAIEPVQRVVQQVQEQLGGRVRRGRQQLLGEGGHRHGERVLVARRL